MNPQNPNKDASSTTIAVAIPTYLREQVLVDTLKQVLSQNPPADEVLVVDQTPEHEPEVTAYLREQHEAGHLRWITQTPPNLPAARNRALQESRCDILLFLDDDVLLSDAGFVERHRCLFSDPRIWAVSGHVCDQWGQMIEISEEEALRRGPHLSAAANVHMTGIPIVRGGHHSIRRSRAMEVGGYDESLVGSAYTEDLDMGMRLGGDRILTTSTCSIVHLRTPTGGCRITDKRMSMPEWTRSVSALVGAFRHGRRWKGLTKTWLLIGLRCGPLRKRVVLRPWLWPWAWLSFVYAVYQGWRRSMVRVRSPFV